MKEEIKRMVIETAYSSKGHFKTADWMAISLASYICVPLATSLVSALFALSDAALRVVSFLGLFFSYLALSSVLANNRDKANRSIETHIDLGNKYLEIYKELRILTTDMSVVRADTLTALQRRISELDRATAKCKISFVGRWWSKLRIYSEMDLHWVDSL